MNLLLLDPDEFVKVALHKDVLFQWWIMNIVSYYYYLLDNGVITISSFYCNKLFPINIIDLFNYSSNFNKILYIIK